MKKKTKVMCLTELYKDILGNAGNGTYNICRKDRKIRRERGLMILTDLRIKAKEIDLGGI